MVSGSACEMAQRTLKWPNNETATVRLQQNATTVRGARVHELTEKSLELASKEISTSFRIDDRRLEKMYDFVKKRGLSMPKEHEKRKTPTKEITKKVESRVGRGARSDLCSPLGYPLESSHHVDTKMRACRKSNFSFILHCK